MIRSKILKTYLVSCLITSNANIRFGKYNFLKSVGTIFSIDLNMHTCLPGGVSVLRLSHKQIHTCFIFRCAFIQSSFQIIYSLCLCVAVSKTIYKRRSNWIAFMTYAGEFILITTVSFSLIFSSLLSKYHSYCSVHIHRYN